MFSSSRKARTQQSNQTCHNTVDTSTAEPVSNRMIVYFDGGCSPNPGKMEACAVVCPAIGKPEIHTLRDLGHGTNTLAEWAALVLAMTVTKDLTEEVVFLGDSQVIVNQANGDWKIKHDHLREMKAEFDTLATGRQIVIKYVPRARNLAGRYLEHGRL